jgi:hypothetical protein
MFDIKKSRSQAKTDSEDENLNNDKLMNAQPFMTLESDSFCNVCNVCNVRFDDMN